MTDAGSLPPSSTQRQAYDLLGKGFGPGFNGPLTLVVDLTHSASKQAALTQLTDAVSASTRHRHRRAGRPQPDAATPP